MQLSPPILQQLSEQLEIEPALLNALFVVESGGRFFVGTPLNESKKIPMLYERHWFYKQIKEKYYKQFGSVVGKIMIDDLVKYNRDICYPKPSNNRDKKIDRYGNNSKQYEKLAKAIAIDEEIAHRSASFGFAQIMGFHYKLCGYESATEMARLWHESEEEQIKGFVDFIENFRRGKVLKHLRNKRFDKVAYYYNGSNYKINRYDKKLRESYNRWVGNA